MMSYKRCFKVPFKECCDSEEKGEPSHTLGGQSSNSELNLGIGYNIISKLLRI